MINHIYAPSFKNAFIFAFMSYFITSILNYDISGILDGVLQAYRSFNTQTISFTFWALVRLFVISYLSMYVSNFIQSFTMSGIKSGESFNFIKYFPFIKDVFLFMLLTPIMILVTLFLYYITIMPISILMEKIFQMDNYILYVLALLNALLISYVQIYFMNYSQGFSLSES
ncbi:MAG: hypothetical protein DGJ47_000236 [Rickettsiaceae bacterium]